MREETLSILPWNTCNATCAHCGPESSPTDKTGVSHERVLELISEASDKYEEPWCLSLSGGEIFLYYDRLLEYCRAACKGGGYVTLITNCFWATSREIAREKLKPLAQNGLRVLGVSADRFHDPFIPIERVKTALTVATELHLRTHLRMAATKSNRLWMVIRDFSDANVWFTDYMEMPCVPAGRAAYEVPPEDFIFQNEYPRGACPGASFTINPSGDGMICCNSAGELPGMNVGSVNEMSLTELKEAFRSSPLVKFLKGSGPAAALELLHPDERGDLESKQYVSVCHLCYDIFKDRHRRERLFDIIREKEWEYLKGAMKGIEQLIPVSPHSGN